MVHDGSSDPLSEPNLKGAAAAAVVVAVVAVVVVVTVMTVVAVMAACVDAHLWERFRQGQVAPLPMLASSRHLQAQPPPRCLLPLFRRSRAGRRHRPAVEHRPELSPRLMHKKDA